MSDAVECGVVGRFRVLAVLTRFVVAPDQEDCVIGACGDRQRRHQRNRERREVHQAEFADQRDRASGCAHFDAHDGQDQQHRADRAVDQGQHDRDDDHRDHGHLDHACVAGLKRIGGQWRRAGDIGLQARRGRGLMDDFADRVHRFVALGAALIANQVQLHVGGFAVTALHAGGGDHVAPEVRDVLNMFLVVVELGYQSVVVPVCAIAQWFVADQNDHRDAVGSGLLEFRPHPLGGDDGRRILR